PAEGNLANSLSSDAPDFELQKCSCFNWFASSIEDLWAQSRTIDHISLHLGGSGVLAYFAGSLESRGGPYEGIEVSGDAFQRCGVVPTLIRTRSCMTITEASNARYMRSKFQNHGLYGVGASGLAMRLPDC